jgi:hypothetical protein
MVPRSFEYPVLPEPDRLSDGIVELLEVADIRERLLEHIAELEKVGAELPTGIVSGYDEEIRRSIFGLREVVEKTLDPVFLGNLAASRTHDKAMEARRREVFGPPDQTAA